MAATSINEGCDFITQWILNQTPAIIPLKLRLYTNNHAPASTDTFVGAQMTEISGAVFTPITLATTWSGSTSAGLSTYTLANQVCTLGAGGAGTTVWGYFLTLTVAATNYIFSASLLGSSYLIPVGGGSLTLGPTWTNQM